MEKRPNVNQQEWLKLRKMLGALVSEHSVLTISDITGAPINVIFLNKDLEQAHLELKDSLTEEQVEALLEKAIIPHLN